MNMKKIIIYLSILMISNIYAQCDDYSDSQCNNDNSCEWVEDIETGNCGNLWGDDCELNPECNWNCDFVDDYMGWCNYSCDGGPYEIDNSYCEEFEYQLGDINEDYTINILDITAAINLILNSEYNWLVDMNSDNQINVLDIVMMVDIILEN